MQMTITDTGLMADYRDEPTMAKELHVTPRTMARYRNEPDGLPYLLLGGRVYYHLPTVRRWLEQRIVKPNPTRARRPRRSA